MLVNRGWVPKNFEQMENGGSDTMDDKESAEVRVVGVVRRASQYLPGTQQLRRWFLPSSSSSSGNSDVTTNQWIYPDVDQMAAYIYRQMGRQQTSTSGTAETSGGQESQHALIKDNNGSSDSMYIQRDFLVEQVLEPGRDFRDMLELQRVADPAEYRGN